MQRVLSSAFCFFRKFLYTNNEYILIKIVYPVKQMGNLFLLNCMNLFDNIDDGHYKNVSSFFQFFIFLLRRPTLTK